MRRKLFVAAFLAATLALAGCAGGLARDDIAGMAKLKKQCETAGGVFTTWLGTAGWFYECDLSTEDER